MKNLTIKTSLLTMLLLGSAQQAYSADINSSAREAGGMAGRFETVQKMMCKSISIPNIDKYIKANDKFFNSQSSYTASVYKTSRDRSKREFAFVLNNMKRKNPNALVKSPKIIIQCKKLDGEAKAQYDQLAMTGIYE